MRDSRDRVTVASWNSILKKYITYVDKTGYTPTFGYIVDRFRIDYNIYISVYPIIKPSITTEGGVSSDSLIIFGYRSEICKLDAGNNNVIIEWTGNDQAFYQAMRDALNKAVEFIDL